MPATASRSATPIAAATPWSPRPSCWPCSPGSTYCWPNEVAMANTRSLSNATALRDENVLRRVRHLGSARDGLQEWRLQRRTALALIPLGLYFVASMLRLAPSDQMTPAAGLAPPGPGPLTFLFRVARLCPPA